MDSHFSAEFFKANRASLRSLFTGTAPIVITANGLMQRGGDTTYRFHQDSSFWYLTGVDEPEATLVIDKDKEYLIVPKREGYNEAFNGITDYEFLSKRSGIETVLGSKEGWERLSRRLKKAKHVATLSAAPNYLEHYRFYTNPARAKLVNLIESQSPDITFLDLRQHLTKLRMIKQPVEMETIKRAIAITMATFKEISTKLSSLKNEYQVEARLTYGFRRRGASGHAYDPIVAGGVNATTLHYQSNNAEFKPRKLLLIDAGAEVEHYASDITRMFSRDEPTKRQSAVFSAVASVHERAISLLKPGVVLKDYEQQIEQFMGEKLRELGLIKLIDHESVHKYYPQLTSHFLGLDVHDVGEYDKPLKPGMVLTVEPGIYIPKEGIGIRLEDDCIITKNGVSILSKKLPHLLMIK